MEEKINVHIIIGSTRQGRFGDKPGKWIFEKAQAHGEMNATLIDLRDHPLPFYDEPMSPAMMEDGYPNPAIQAFADLIKTGDAFIVCGPEYNHSMSAVLKNAFDSVYREWNNKPIGFVSWGSVGGARSVEQMRLVAVELQMAPIRNAIHIPSPWNRMKEDGSATDDAFADVEDKVDGLFEQLLWWAHALKGAREK